MMEMTPKTNKHPAMLMIAFFDKEYVQQIQKYNPDQWLIAGKLSKEMKRKKL